MIDITRSKLPTVIIRYPSGRYGIAGSIPLDLTEPARHGTPQWPPLLVSKVWETEKDAIAALVEIGFTKFQLADCSWYDANA